MCPQWVIASHTHLATVNTAQYGLYIMCRDTSFGHQYQNVCATVPARYMVTDAARLVVRHTASTVTCGDTMDTTACHMDGKRSATNSTTAARPAVATAIPTAICEQYLHSSYRLKH